MEIGISTASFFGRLDTEEAVAKMGDMKVKTCEIFLDSHCEYEEGYARDTAALAREKGVGIYSVHSLSTQFEPQLYSISQRQRSDARHTLEKVLKAAEIMGAKVYVFHGPVNFKRHGHMLIDFHRWGALTHDIAEMCAQRGVKLAFENVHWCAYSVPGFASNLLDACSHDNLYFALDVKQAVQSGFSVGDFIRDMGKRIANVHICDYRIGDDGLKLCLPGTGEFDFQKLHADLRERGYDGPVIIEVYRDNYVDYEELANCYALMCALFKD